MVSYRFPPQNVGGSLRAVKFMKYLSRRGWKVDVVVPRDGDREGFERDLSGGNLTIHELHCPRPFDWIFGRLKRLFRPAPNAAPRAAPKCSRSASRPPPLWLRFLLLLRFPDEAAWWGPGLTDWIGRFFRDHPDCRHVYVHGPPFSPFLAVLRGNRKWQRRLVFDFRDPWSADPDLELPFQCLRGPLRRWEKRVLGSGHPIVTVTPALADQFASLAPDSADRLFVITNGYDPEDVPSELSFHERSRFVLAHAGNLAGRNVRPFFRAAGLLVARHPGLRTEVRIVLWGVPDPRAEHEIRELALQDIVETRGVLPHRKWIEAAREAAAFLLFQTYGPSDGTAIPGKLFEYAALRRPVLAFGSGGETEKIIARSGWGEYFAGGASEDEIAASLLKYHQRWKTGTLIPFGDTSSLAEFSREFLAAKLEDVLERG